MEAYTGFAGVYDRFMDNVPYEKWCGYVTGLLKENKITDGLLLELGCGTGTLTELLAKQGYDMIGIDNSEDMLSIAMDKKAESGQEILYLLQDMREFELYGTVRAVISICDSMNYITEAEDLLQVFCLVNNYLDPGGLFLFDLNTVYKYRELLADHIFAENREDCSFIWENEFDEETMLNEYLLTLFIREKEKNCYQKFDEVHYQRAYELAQIRELLNESGLRFMAAYEAFTKDPVRNDSERIYVLAKKPVD
ncbi:MAG TPA: class I SAM-dependent methyltransferase [Lachnospiraceae bacterium]|nr:class I SAM-dependent methyltransferase [Lachnospiraceae bacterium]